jgi:streptogramin lyase
MGIETTSGSATTTFEGTMDAAGAFTITVREPPAQVLGTITGPANCTNGFSSVPTGVKSALFTQMQVVTASGLQSGTLIKTNATAKLTFGPGDQFNFFLYADRDARITATCPPSTSGTSTQIDWTLKKGWNSLLAEYLEGNVVRFSNGPIPNNVVWQFVPATGQTIKLENAPQTLDLGQSVQLNATVTQPDGTPIAGPQPKLTWTSSDPSVIAVNANGLIAAKRLGGALVSVAVTDAPATGTQVSVTVQGLEATGGTLNVNDKSLGVAARLRYSDEFGNPATQSYNVTLTGPSGWNGGQPLAAKVTVPPPEPGMGRSSINIFTTEVPAVNGAYQIRLDSDPVNRGASAMRAGGATPSPLELPVRALNYPMAKPVPVARALGGIGKTASFTVDTATRLSTPQNLRFSNRDNDVVELTWTAGDYMSVQYESEVLDLTAGTVFSPRQVRRFNSVSFDLASFDKTHAYQFRVYSFTYNLNAPFSASMGTVVQDFRPLLTQLEAFGGSSLGGYTMSLYGSNLTADTRVFFGSSEVTTKSLRNPTEMQVVVPPGAAGTVDVTLQDARGVTNPANTQRFKYFAVNEFASPQPLRLLAAPTGGVYFLDYDSSKTPPSGLVKLSANGDTTRVPLPDLYVYDIRDTALDGAGRVWLALTNKLVRVNADNTLTTIDLPAGVSVAAIAFGADGNVWLARSDTNKITRVQPDGTAATDFNLIGSGYSSFSYGADLRLGPDGNLWFTNSDGYGRITPSGAITTFSGRVSSPLVVAGGALWGNDGSTSTLLKIQTDGTKTAFTGGCFASGSLASSSATQFWCASGIGLSGPARLESLEVSAGGVVRRSVFFESRQLGVTISDVITDANGKVWYINGSRVGVFTP